MRFRVKVADHLHLSPFTLHPYLRIETVLKVNKNTDKTDDMDKHSF